MAEIKTHPIDYAASLREHAAWCRVMGIGHVGEACDAIADAIDKAVAEHSGVFVRGGLDDGPLLPTARPPNGRWTEEDDAEIVRLLGQGLTHESIGTVLGRTRDAIAQRICRKGLKVSTSSDPGTA